VFLAVAYLLCLALAYVVAESWKDYMASCETLEQIEKITTGIKAVQKQRVKELESYLGDSVVTLPDGDDVPGLRKRPMLLSDPLPGLLSLPEPR